MDRQTLFAHYADEGDSAYIYSVLAGLAPTQEAQRIFRDLEKTELKHQKMFASLLEDQGVPVPAFRPSARMKFMAFLARHGFADAVMRMRLSDESRETRSYLTESGQSKSIPRSIAKDEALHANTLNEFVNGKGNEIWHKSHSGGILRNVVYGFNDGLTANFGLIMGVIGSSASENALLVSGIAGLIADTLSMGASGYLAAVSEREVNEHEIAMERGELELMPQEEEHELSYMYQARGLPKKEADQVARVIMKANKETALSELVTHELGITPGTVHPMREGITTGLATMVGALIPLIPLFFGSTTPYIAVSFAISMASHFGVGAIRSVFTGRDPIRSGFDMFVVGLGVAVIGYIAGMMVEKIL